MNNWTRIGILLIPAVIYQATILRLVILQRYQSNSAVVGMIVLLAFVSLIGPYFSLRPNVSDQIVDLFFPKAREAISFPPGRLLSYSLNVLNYISAICFFLSMQRPEAIIRW